MKMKGFVKWYKPNKGYGYIIGSDGNSYYFNINDCINIDEEFKSGDYVLFIPVFEEMEYATQVEKVS